MAWVHKVSRALACIILDQVRDFADSRTRAAGGETTNGARKEGTSGASRFGSLCVVGVLLLFSGTLHEILASDHFLTSCPRACSKHGQDTVQTPETSSCDPVPPLSVPAPVDLHRQRQVQPASSLATPATPAAPISSPMRSPSPPLSASSHVALPPPVYGTALPASVAAMLSPVVAATRAPSSSAVVTPKVAQDLRPAAASPLAPTNGIRIYHPDAIFHAVCHCQSGCRN